jgi:hypothetical protein
MSINTGNIASAILKQEAQEREALKLLLDKQLNQSHHLVVTESRMGGTVSYVGSVTLEWLAQRVRFASHLPLFQHKIDPKTKKIIIDQDTIDEISQRNPDWSRQAAITQYLVTRPNHKFPPVLVVLTRPWVEDPDAPEWGPDGRAMSSTTSFLPLDSHGRVGLLDLSEDTAIFALDGQHRLMGAQGVAELLHKGSIPRLTKDRKEQGSITLEALAETYEHVSSASIQSLLKERIGIEIIAAVNEGEYRDPARQRVRGVFVHVNMMAAALSKGDLALLNEDDGFAILAKKAAIEHDLLRKREGVPSRVEWERPTLVKSSSAFTTLETLKECAHDYLSGVTPYTRWRPHEKGLVPIRPEEAELEVGLERFFTFLGMLSALPSVQEMAEGGSPSELRPFTKDGGKSLGIYRPVVQRALATALGLLINVRGMSVDSVSARLRTLDASGAFRIDEVSSPFWGVLYDFSGEKMRDAGRELASDTLRFMLGGGFQDESERENLRAALTARREDPLAGTTIGWDGRPLEPGVSLALPPVL